VVPQRRAELREARSIHLLPSRLSLPRWSVLTTQMDLWDPEDDIRGTIGTLRTSSQPS
jgi:hypothetical protein